MMFLDLALRSIEPDDPPSPWFQFFGPTIVRLPDRSSLLGPKLRQLIAVLAITPRRIVPLQALYAELWSGDKRPRTYSSTLQSNVMTLRAYLGDRDRAPEDRLILTRPEVGYMLNVPDNQVDVLLFGKLAQQAGALLGKQNFEEAVRVLERAFYLANGDLFWSIERGPLLRQFELDLAKIGESAVLAYYRAMLALGRHRECVSGLQLQWVHNQKREDLTYLAMLALGLCDRWDEALRTYQDTRRQLLTGSNIEPGEKLAALQYRLLVKDPKLLKEAPTLAVA